jgi:HSP20 family molecular chaperone IbpA
MRSLAFLALAAVVGCSRSDQTATDEPVSTTTVTAAPMVFAGNFATPDEELSRRAVVIVAADPDLSITSEDVALDVTEGVVTIHGATRRPPTQAETDDAIAFGVERALLHDAAVVRDADRVSVRVEHGVVTVHGTSTSEEARERVTAVASRTRGVVSVDNHITLGAKRRAASDERREP